MKYSIAVGSMELPNTDFVSIAERNLSARFAVDVITSNGIDRFGIAARLSLFPGEKLSVAGFKVYKRPKYLTMTMVMDALRKIQDYIIASSLPFSEIKGETINIKECNANEPVNGETFKLGDLISGERGAMQFHMLRCGLIDEIATSDSCYTLKVHNGEVVACHVLEYLFD